MRRMSEDLAERIASGVAISTATFFLEEMKELKPEGPAKEFITRTLSQLEALKLKPNINFAENKQNGMGAILGIVTGQGFNRERIVAYFEGSSNARIEKILVLKNPNLKEAARRINRMLATVGGCMKHRMKEWTGDKQYSLALLTLYSSLQCLFDEVTNENTLHDILIDNLNLALETLSSEFNKFAQSTFEKTKENRRGKINFLLAECQKECEKNLKRFKIAKPLENKITHVRITSGALALTCQEMLLSFAIVDYGTAVARRPYYEILEKKDQLHNIVADGPKEIEKNLREMKMTKMKEGKEITITTNPFRARISEILAHEKKYDAELQQWEEAPTPLVPQPNLDFEHAKQFLYIKTLFKIFNNLSTSNNRDIKKHLEEFEAEYKRVSPSREFKALAGMLKASLTSSTHLQEIDFIQTTIHLMHQSTKLAYFMEQLEEFIKMVGKLGIHESKDLHKFIAELMAQAMTTIESNLIKMEDLLNPNPPEGSWFFALQAMLKEVCLKGKSALSEFESMRSSFMLLADRQLIAEEFQDKKNRLLEAAQGLGLSTGYSLEKIKELTGVIKMISPITFIKINSSMLEREVALLEAIEEQTHLADEQKSLADAQNKMVSELKETMEAQNKIISGLKIDFENKMIDLKNAELALDKKINETTSQLEDCNRVVTTFFTEFKKDLMQAQKDASKDLIKAEKLVELIQQQIPSLFEVSKKLKSEESKVHDTASCLVESILTNHSEPSYGEMLSEAIGIQASLASKMHFFEIQLKKIDDFQMNYMSKSGATVISLEDVREHAREIKNNISHLEGSLKTLQILIEGLKQKLIASELKNSELERKIENLSLKLEQANVQSTKLLEESKIEQERIKKLEEKVEEEKKLLVVRHSEELIKLQSQLKKVEKTDPSDIGMERQEKFDPAMLDKVWLNKTKMIANQFALKIQKNVYLESLRDWIRAEPSVNQRIAMSNYLSKQFQGHLLAKENNLGRRLFGSTFSTSTTSMWEAQRELLGTNDLKLNAEDIKQIQFSAERRFGTKDKRYNEIGFILKDLKQNKLIK